MKICVFEIEDELRFGEVRGNEVFTIEGEPDVLGVAGLLPYELQNPNHTGEKFNLDSIELLSPVLVPPRIFGIGLNYHDHAAETGRTAPEVQTWFMKQCTAINDPYGEIEKPVVSDFVDFEVELVVVIGKTCRHVPASRAHEVILGYCVGNDVSVRDWQRATPTMIMGKGFDTHAPIGPYLVTPDELGNLDDLRLRCFVNGEKMQDGALKDLIFKVPQMIEHLSTAFTLLPGDLLFTGTPAGVGVARNPPIFLKDGDIVRCEIDKIGAIENLVVNEVKEIIID